MVIYGQRDRKTEERPIALVMSLKGLKKEMEGEEGKEGKQCVSPAILGELDEEGGPGDKGRCDQAFGPGKESFPQGEHHKNGQNAENGRSESGHKFDRPESQEEMGQESGQGGLVVVSQNEPEGLVRHPDMVDGIIAPEDDASEVIETEKASDREEEKENGNNAEFPWFCHRPLFIRGHLLCQYRLRRNRAGL